MESGKLWQGNQVQGLGNQTSLSWKVNIHLTMTHIEKGFELGVGQDALTVQGLYVYSAESKAAWVVFCLQT